MRKKTEAEIYPANAASLAKEKISFALTSFGLSDSSFQKNIQLALKAGLPAEVALKALAELIQKNIELVGMPVWNKEEEQFALALQQELKSEEKGLFREVRNLKEPSDTFIGGGSTDVGDVTLIAPTATVRFPAKVPGAIGHHWSTVASVYGSIGWKGLNSGARVLALSAIDLMTRPGELRKVRAEFEEYLKAHPYKSFLPAEAQPPLDLNKPLMDKWRHLLEKEEIRD